MDTTKLQHGFEKAKEFASNMKDKLPGFDQKKANEPVKQEKVDTGIDTDTDDIESSKDIKDTDVVNRDADEQVA